MTDRSQPRHRAAPIAVYSGDGVQEDTVRAMCQALEDGRWGRPTPLPAGAFRIDGLWDFRLVVLPGGRASAMCRELGAPGRAALRDFAAGGGSVLGICAGVYALSSGYPWSIRMLPIQVLDVRHWRRGEGRVGIRFTPEGRSLFLAPPDTLSVPFQNGPVVAPFPAGSNPRYEVLATYQEEMAHLEGTRGLMAGSPAALAAAYGRGCVLAIGPHLEHTQAQRGLLANAVHRLLLIPQIPAPRIGGRAGQHHAGAVDGR